MPSPQLSFALDALNKRLAQLQDEELLSNAAELQAAPNYRQGMVGEHGVGSPAWDAVAKKNQRRGDIARISQTLQGGTPDLHLRQGGSVVMPSMDAAQPAFGQDRSAPVQALQQAARPSVWGIPSDEARVKEARYFAGAENQIAADRARSEADTNVGLSGTRGMAEKMNAQTQNEIASARALAGAQSGIDVLGMDERAGFSRRSGALKGLSEAATLATVGPEKRAQAEADWRSYPAEKQREFTQGTQFGLQQLKSSANFSMDREKMQARMLQSMGTNLTRAYQPDLTAIALRKSELFSSSNPQDIAELGRLQDMTDTIFEKIFSTMSGAGEAQPGAAGVPLRRPSPAGGRSPSVINPRTVKQDDFETQMRDLNIPPEEWDSFAKEWNLTIVPRRPAVGIQPG
jgi:hypothetical protein